MQETHLKNKKIHTISLSQVLRTLRKITHGQLIQRDMFQERIKAGEELFMHEMLYPVIVGIDSHIIAKIYGSCDLEVGGTDQHFNMLMGRPVMKMHKQEEQAVLSFELLEGTDGKEKMSKSLDNYIGITDEPNDMYGKVMSTPDELIIRYFTLCTYTPLAQIEAKKRTLESSDGNPRDMKMELARQIVAIYHGEKAAEQAEQAFVQTFAEGGIPDDIPEITASSGVQLAEVLADAGIVKSKSDFRRLVGENAITNVDTQEKIVDEKITVEETVRLKIGKKRFVKIVI